MKIPIKKTDQISEDVSDTPREDSLICCVCGTTENLEYGPDPYAEDVNGDDTAVWECFSCRQQSADDI